MWVGREGRSGVGFPWQSQVYHVVHIVSSLFLKCSLTSQVHMFDSWGLAAVLSCTQNAHALEMENKM